MAAGQSGQNYSVPFIQITSGKDLQEASCLETVQVQWSRGKRCCSPDVLVYSPFGSIGHVSSLWYACIHCVGRCVGCLDFVGWWILFVTPNTDTYDAEVQELTQCTCAVARLDFAGSTFKYSTVIIVQAWAMKGGDWLLNENTETLMYSAWMNATEIKEVQAT